MCIAMLPYFEGGRLILHRCFEWALSVLPSDWLSEQNLFGAGSQQKLLFMPDADNEPKVGHKISEAAIFRFLLNEEYLKQLDEGDTIQMLDVLKDIDKQSKITQVEAHQSSMGLWKDLKNAFHAFIVFKSTSETADDGDWWWSLEKNSEYIVLQRSRNKENVKDKLEGNQRKKVKPVAKNLVGKGTIKYLFAVLWAQQMIEEKYHILDSNCQSLVTFVAKQITKIGYEYNGFFPVTPPPKNERETEMLDLVNILAGCSECHPLITLSKIGNIDVFDKIVASGKYDINALYNGQTPLHLAIENSKTKMVQHLLKDADPMRRDKDGISALLWAAMITMKAEIFDLLLAHPKVKVDDVDEDGYTALHLAASVSNVVAVQKLLERGANPSITDNWGQSPLHVAALQEDGDAMFDLLLAHDKVKVHDVDENGETALHLAARGTNVDIFIKLLERGANPNIFNKEGTSPLHLAVEKNRNEFIDLLLSHGKVMIDHADENGHTALHLAAWASNVIAVQKLIEKGANPSITDKIGRFPLHVAAERRDGNPIIDLLIEAHKVKGMGDVNYRNENGVTALHWAAYYSNEITAEHLIQKGADLNRRNIERETSLHYAALGANNMNIIDLLLNNINEGEIEQYRNDKRLFLLVKRNVYGLEVEIGDRFLEKGIKPPNSEETVDEYSAQEIDAILNDLNDREQIGQTLLFFAIYANNVNAVRLLLENGADHTIRNEYGLTPFHVAAGINEDCDILHLLLANGKVDINERTSHPRMTALHIAIMYSNLIAVRFLLSNGANPNVAIATLTRRNPPFQYTENGDTPLHYAARNAKDMDIVELLLNHPDVDVNCLNNWGESALDYAMENKKGNGLGDKIANLLKEKGAVESEIKLKQSGSRIFLKKQMRDFSNRNPDEIENYLNDATVPIRDKVRKVSGSEEYLLSAIKDSNVENVRILLKNGADISTCCTGEKGTNALHMASRYAKTTDLIDVVRETGKFDINGVDNNGWTPLHYAIGGTNYVINARYLLEKGADPNIVDKEGSTPLHMAAYRANEIETISLILTDNKQVDVNHRDQVGKTALHVAIKARHVITARYLLKRGADPTIGDNKGLTPFHLAAKLLTDTDILGLMLKNEKNMNIDESDQEGSTALYLAMTTSNLIAAGFLLSNGANPNAADVNGLTPLHLVVKYAKDMDIVELLLNHPDVNVNCLDMKGRSALDYATMNTHGHGERIAKLLKEKGVISQTGNYLDTKKFFRRENIMQRVLTRTIVGYSNAGEVNFLLHMGADLSTVTFGEEKKNALCMASARAKKTKILDIILETGQFDINDRDEDGWTPLHCALNDENLITARYLLKRGADPTTSDKEGITPFHMAAYHATTDIVSLILKRFLVNINCRDVNGTTALHYAIGAKNVDIARYLLKNGADPFNRDHTGYTPFHLAAQHLIDTDILGLMLTNEKKIDIEESDQKGSTALHLAIWKSNIAAARFLLSNGANPNVANKYGNTPLHLVAYYAKDMDIVELLLNHKDVDVNLLNNKGYSALDYAIDNEHGLSEEIANLLMGKRAAKTYK